MSSAGMKMTPETGATGKSVKDAAVVDRSEVETARVAYQLWLARGCPNGSDQEDWFRAEEILKTK